jgi:phage terminase large subunit-like protein
MTVAEEPITEGVEHGSLEQYEAFCLRNIRVGDPARPLRLDPFQRTVLRDYFDGCAETLILLPKGNGKSTLLAALALYHLAVVPFADVKIVASSRPAAEQLFEFAHKMVMASARLKRRFKVTASTREIRTREGLGYLKALPAELRSIDGKAPTLVLADELHHWSKPEVYAFLAGGLGKRGGRLVGITTAGADITSFLGQIRTNALRHLVTQEGAYKYARTADGSFAMHEWSLNDGDDYEDFAAVKEANPLSTITVESLERMFNSPSTVPVLWCRLHCNQWVQDSDAYIDQGEWRDNARPGCRIPEGVPVFIGCDFGWRRDSTALVPVGVLSQSPLMVRVDERLEITYPPVNGGSSKVADVKRQLQAFYELWPDAITVLDPNAGGNLIAEYLSDELEVTVVIQSQDASPMAHAAGLVSELVRDGRLEHPDNADYTRQIINAPAQSVGTGGDKLRFGKHRDGVPNDAAIATALAVRQAAVQEEEAPVMPVFLT